MWNLRVTGVKDDIRALSLVPLSLRKVPLVKGMRGYMKVAKAKAKQSNYGFTDRDGQLRRRITTVVTQPTRRRPFTWGYFRSGSKARPLVYGYIVEWREAGRFSWQRRAIRDTARKAPGIFAREVDRWARGSTV